MFRIHRALLLSLGVTLLGVSGLACGTNGAPSAGMQDAGRAGAGASDAGTSDAASPTAGAGAAGAGAHQGGDTSAAGRRDDGLAEPTVVYAHEGVLAGLALAGNTLYVSVAAGLSVDPMTPGSIVSVSKDATGAAVDAGATTVIAGISPRAIAVVDDQLYWDEGGPGSAGAVMTAPVTGGTPRALFVGGSSTYVQTRLVIVNGVIHVMATGSGVGRVIWSAPLASAGTPDISLKSHSDPLTAIAADEANVFFLVDSGTKDALGTTILDLEEVEPGSGGNGVLRLWPAAATTAFPAYMFLVNDATTLYWSDGKTISSFPKVPKPTDVPTVVGTFVMPPAIDVQLLIDGPNLYALTPYQLVRIAKTGGTPLVLASSAEGTFDQSPTNALGMAVDGTFIYFLDAGRGRILKLPK